MGRKALLSCTAVLALLCASCGGGGGSGSTSPPAPAPTQTPTPTPPSAAPIGRVFAASSVGLCSVFLYTDAERRNDAGFGSCSREGTFGSNVAMLRPPAITTGLASFTQHYVMVQGIESAGSTFVQYTGPLGSKIYSPLTSLIDGAGSQARVKQAFGLDGGIFFLATDPDLTVFDPAVALALNDEDTRHEGARVAAANLRAMATAAGIQAVFNGTPDPYAHVSVGTTDYGFLGRWIGTDSRFIFDNARMTAILVNNRTVSDGFRETLSAAAHIIDTYAAAMGVQVSDPAFIAQYVLGIRGYLQPELEALVRTNTPEAAAAAQSLTPETIRARIAVFMETVPANTSGFLFPGPDFFSTTSDTISIRAGAGGLPDITVNDLYFRTQMEGSGIGTGGQVISITVPASKTGQVAATLSAGAITATAVGGFKGTTYFDYRVRIPAGEEATGRVYVTFS